MALIGSLDSGVSALRNFSKGLEVIGDNIANVNTVGFKGSTTNYHDTFSDVLQRSTPGGTGGGSSSTTATQIGSGVQIGSITANFGQGTVSSTGVPTDLAIAGGGFFRVRDAATGAQYASRGGDFRLDNSGNLVTNDGKNVQGLTGGSISFSASVNSSGQLVYTPTKTDPTAVGDMKVGYDASVGSGITNDTAGTFTDAQVEAQKPKLDSYSFGQDGSLTLYLSNGDSFKAGQVLLQNYQDPNALIKEGNNLFSGMDAAGPIGGITLTAANNTPGSGTLGSIQSGSLELSNVDLTKEFSDLITTQRSFQAASRIVTVSDQVLEEIVSLKR